MNLVKSIVFSLLLIGAAGLQADTTDYTTLTLEELKAVDRGELGKDEAKLHKKALKKAKKLARKEALKNRPRKPYCSKQARARGTCY